jgi:hypothetical protein
VSHCRAPSRPKVAVEVAFGDPRDALGPLEALGKLLGVVLRKRRKEHNIQRLQTVCRMWWVHHNHDAFGFTILQEIGREVAGVAVKDQKAPLPASFGCREAFKDLLKLGKSQIII